MTLNESIRPFKPEQLLSESQIIARWQGWQPGDPVEVSIVCITFNHGKYIQDAICGFLAQVTSFPYEIIIHDDASTDETHEIIKAFACLYPRIIRLILQAENQYSQGNSPFEIAFNQANGQYIALCEGDDYWLHKEKLTMQIGILEANIACNLVYHRVAPTSSEGECFELGNQVTTGNRNFCFFDSLQGKNGATLSMVFRNASWLKFRGCNILRDFEINDWPLECLLTYSGNGYFLDKTLGVYRRHAGSVTNTLNIDKYIYTRIEFAWRLRNLVLDQQSRRVLESFISRVLGQKTNQLLRRGKYVSGMQCLTEFLFSCNMFRGYSGIKWESRFKYRRILLLMPISAVFGIICKIQNIASNGLRIITRARGLRHANDSQIGSCKAKTDS